MVDVKHKKCIYENCILRPHYNYKNETTTLYCAKHKKKEMIDVINKRCIYTECEVIANFNYEGNTKTLYCIEHRKEGMVNVKHKKCIYENCKTRPTFNFIGESIALYCFIHKKEKMMDVINKKCIELNCETIPIYNVEGEIKSLYCALHKKEEMVNVKDPHCKTYLCSTIVKEKYDGYCLFCYINMFPDKPVSRNYKTKEYAVVDFVKSLFSDFTWITDKNIQGGCSKRRPDLLLDLGYQVIIIEIDENQHIDYDCSCENKRIMELSQDTGHRPIVFIRFNPDDYSNKDINVTSCWGTDKKGICKVKKSKQKEWTDRLSVLDEQIKYWINPDNQTNKTIEVIQLFYDI